jgi:cystathionine beta-lyase/cystathionine gamma-synthase
MFNNILPRFNVTVTYVDGTKTENFEKAIQHNTTLIYLESPNSWNFALQDLEAVAKIAKAKNIITVCDNSYCTPLYQNPIAYGIDLVVQSATKYLNGHSDVIAGVITASREMIAKIYFSEFMNMGISTTPFNAWLLIRGLRTLPMRLEKITTNTKQVLAFLKNHEKVEEIIFPFDKDFAQYDLAKKQMRGACGLFSFYIKASTIAEIENFCEGLKHILMAVSWGGYESLIIPGCASIKAGEFDPNNKDHRILRMFVGMEDPEYIIEDLQRGFKAM